MTMTQDHSMETHDKAFWLSHPDPTQAAVHLALQWLAYVYPASELQIDRTLKRALPYADADLSSRWSQFLDEHDVEDHVEALEWIAKTLSSEQIPFLVETCWRLLLADHELPSHVPLALRILGRVLSVSEEQMLSIGDSVYREFADEEQNKAPLLPVDPRYLDRIEWRLYGATATTRLNVGTTKPKAKKNYSGLVGFGWGSLFGAAVALALVFGPLQLGRVKVPIILHELQQVPEASSTTAPVSAPTESTISEPVADPAAQVAEVQSTDNTENNNASDVSESVNDLLNESIDESVAEVIEPTATAEPAEPKPASERVLMVVTASILNVRETASVDSEIVLKLAEGARVWAYPDQAVGLWMNVHVEGISGFASARFLAEVTQ